MKKILQKLILLIQINRISLLGISAGVVLGYLHWFFWGCYWGTYPLSSECWVNCIYGGLFFGYIALAMFKDRQISKTGDTEG